MSTKNASPKAHADYLVVQLNDVIRPFIITHTSIYTRGLYAMVGISSDGIRTASTT